MYRCLPCAVLQYVQNDRGPVSGVWPLWVPQLQAHMAAAGAFSGLLLSRSPTRGVRLFRMYRWVSGCGTTAHSPKHKTLAGRPSLLPPIGPATPKCVNFHVGSCMGTRPCTSGQHTRNRHHPRSSPPATPLQG